MSSCTSGYSPSSLVDSLHTFPRFDLHFYKTSNPSFEPENRSYIEGLGVWAVIAAAFSILLLLVSLVYLVCTCCCFPRRRRIMAIEPKTGSAWCRLFFVVLIAAVAVGVATYGGAKALDDANSVIDGANEIDASLDTAKDEVSTIRDHVGHVNSELGALLGLANDTNVRELVNEALIRVNDVTERIDEIDDKIDDVDLDEYVAKAKEYRRYGEYGMIPYFCLLGLVVVLPFLGILCCRKTAFCLKFFAFLALIGILFCGLMSGATMGISLAGSDLCMNPDGYLLNYTSNADDRDVIEYYIYCTNCSFPYIEYFNEAYQYADELQSLFQSVDALLPPGREKEHLQEAMASSSDTLESIRRLHSIVTCDDINESYHKSRDAVCKEMIDAFVILLLATVVSSLPIMLLIMCEQNTWRKIQTMKDYYRSIDTRSERSPLISRTEHSHLEHDSSNAWNDDGSSRCTTPNVPPPNYADVASDQ